MYRLARTWEQFSIVNRVPIVLGLLLIISKCLLFKSELLRYCICVAFTVGFGLWCNSGANLYQSHQVINFNSVEIEKVSKCLGTNPTLPWPTISANTHLLSLLLCTHSQSHNTATTHSQHSKAPIPQRQGKLTPPLWERQFSNQDFYSPSFLPPHSTSSTTLPHKAYQPHLSR